MSLAGILEDLRTHTQAFLPLIILLLPILTLLSFTDLRRSSRGLRTLTSQIRKIDETANIKITLPRQLGYVSGLQEIYARRVGLGGCIPAELGQLSQLRVLSLGNNYLCGELPPALGNLRNLQRIVLHQNNLQGSVPPEFSVLGCIVNLAGNAKLQHGPDVPAEERQALVDIFTSTHGARWNTKTNWNSSQPVAKWYKVGILSSHVHSIVMSSNGMEGQLPGSICKLSQLRMIELATMPGNSSTPKSPRHCELCYQTRINGRNPSGALQNHNSEAPVHLQVRSQRENTSGNRQSEWPGRSDLAQSYPLYHINH